MVQNGWELDHESSIPLHVQFEQRMIDHIQSGEWKPGDKIPSERDLMGFSNISRATVRQAMNALAHQNILEKVHGSGTFVKLPKFEQRLEIAYSFSEQIRRLGFKLEDRLLERHLTPATPDLAAQLQIPEGSDVIYIHRLRMISGTPVMVNKAYIPYALCPGLLDESFDNSLYQLLVNRYQLPIIQATDHLEAVASDRDLCHLLQISNRIPIMFVERIAFTHDGTGLHVGLTHIRGDMCYFRINLMSQPSTLAIKKV
ncbi:MAG: GntR family transcriptional regulator [Anaerolineae bacterium]|nr:GntR family transcriptional regulator [Anaerolineae bacterium]